MREDDDLAVYYAPVNWCNPEARLALIGVTPGFTQMELAFRIARRELLAGADPETACRHAKAAAAFGGPLRQNLVQMLDELGLRAALGYSGAALFGEARHLVHATSAVCYPAFVGGENYTGSRPRLVRSPFLMNYARKHLAPELSSLPDAVYLPLGRAVEEVLRALELEGHLPRGRVLYGFPHPSGANGHRQHQLNKVRGRLAQQLAAAFK